MPPKPPVPETDRVARALDKALERVRRDGPMSKPFARVFDPENEEMNRHLVRHIRRLMAARED